MDQAAEKVEKKQGGATVEQKARIKWEGCQGVESLFGSHGFYVIFDMFFLNYHKSLLFQHFS